MKTEEKENVNELKDRITRIEDGVIINGQSDNDKMTSEELKEALSKVKTVRLEHDDRWLVPNDLDVFDVRKINPVSSDEETLEIMLISIRCTRKLNGEAIMQHKDTLTINVIEQLKMRGFDVEFMDDWIKISWRQVYLNDI